MKKAVRAVWPILLTAVCLSTAGAGQEWTRFRGPNGTGISMDSGATGNTVGGNNFNGLNAVGSGGGSLNLTIQGNSFATTQTSANDGYAIDIQSGVAGGSTDCLFLDLGDMSAGHTVPANNNTILGSNWVNGVGGHTISLASFQSSQMKLRNLTTFTDAGASAWSAASNTNGGTDAFHLGSNQFGGVGINAQMAGGILQGQNTEQNHY